MERARVSGSSILSCQPAGIGTPSAAASSAESTPFTDALPSVYHFTSKGAPSCPLKGDAEDSRGCKPARPPEARPQSTNGRGLGVARAEAEQSLWKRG